jgi:hypothetical protein
MKGSMPMTQKEKDMNMTQVRVLLQYVVTYAMGYVVAKGYLPQDVATEVGAAIVAVIPALYSTWKSRDAGKIETAAKVAGVTIVAPNEIATATPATNVVSSDTHSVTGASK